VHVARNGSPSTHPLRGPELRALRSWKRRQDEMAPYVFTSLRGGPVTIRTIHFVVAAAGRRLASNSPLILTCRAARPASTWANTGQDTRTIQLYLDHKNIQHTVRYTELSPQRFKDFWKD